jgi:hypothetical protein
VVTLDSVESQEKREMGESDPGIIEQLKLVLGAEVSEWAGLSGCRSGGRGVKEQTYESVRNRNMRLSGVAWVGFAVGAPALLLWHRDWMFTWFLIGWIVADGAIRWVSWKLVLTFALMLAALSFLGQGGLGVVSLPFAFVFERDRGESTAREMVAAAGITPKEPAVVKPKPKGARYRNLIVALGLCLACGGAGEVVPIGPGTYMAQRRIRWTQGFAAVAEATGDAR